MTMAGLFQGMADGALRLYFAGVERSQVWLGWEVAWAQSGAMEAEIPEWGSSQVAVEKAAATNLLIQAKAGLK